MQTGSVEIVENTVREVRSLIVEENPNLRSLSVAALSSVGEVVFERNEPVSVLEFPNLGFVSKPWMADLGARRAEIGHPRTEE